MAKLSKLCEKIRSKNAGPFWLTIDVFCGNADAFKIVENGLETKSVAAALGQPAESLKRFAMPELNVVKFSLPRPQVQGSRLDRDMHGAQWAILVAGCEVDESNA